MTYRDNTTPCIAWDFRWAIVQIMVWGEAYYCSEENATLVSVSANQLQTVNGEVSNDVENARFASSIIVCMLPIVGSYHFTFRVRGQAANADLRRYK